MVMLGVKWLTTVLKKEWGGLVCPIQGISKYGHSESFHLMIFTSLNKSHTNVLRCLINKLQSHHQLNNLLETL